MLWQFCWLETLQIHSRGCVCVCVCVSPCIQNPTSSWGPTATIWSITFLPKCKNLWILYWSPPAPFSQFSAEQAERVCTKCCQNTPLLCWKPSRWLPISEHKLKPLQRPSPYTRAPNPTSLTTPVLAHLLQLHFRILTLLFLLECLSPQMSKSFQISPSLPSNLCSNTTFSKEAFPPHFKLRPPAPLLCFMCLHYPSHLLIYYFYF